MKFLDYSARVDLQGRFELVPGVEGMLSGLLTSPTRRQIERFEYHLAQHPQIDIPVKHEFAPGMYVRTICIPEGALMTGRVHTDTHLSIMLCGDMTVLTETGMRRITGHNVFISPPGLKRVGYAHKYTEWLTAHATDETDIEVLERTIVEPWSLENVRNMRIQ